MSVALQGYISNYLAGRIAIDDWTKLLAAHDANNGKPAYPIKATDLAAQLRILTTPFGSRGHLFDLSRAQQRLVGELRDVRNAWAHGSDFDADDLYRALDTGQRLLNSFELTEAAGKIAAIIQETRTPTGPSLDEDKTDPVGKGPGQESDGQPTLGSGPEAESKSVPSDSDSDSGDRSPEAPGYAGNISLTVSHNVSINYATAQARFPILDRVEIDYKGEEPISVLVTASLTSGRATVSTVAERRDGYNSGQDAVA